MGDLGSPKYSSSPARNANKTPDHVPNRRRVTGSNLTSKGKSTRGWKSTPLKVININCQSVKKKLPQFLAMLDAENPDIVVGTESFLKDDITNGEIFPNTYQIFRKDRSNNTSRGGVFVAVKNSLVATEKTDHAMNSELAWINIQIKGAKPLYIGALYRQPDNCTDSLIELQASLEKLPQGSHILLLGDFNLPDVIWPSQYFTPGGRYPTASKLMLQIASDFNLLQHVDKPTRLDSILDLCFCTNASLIHDIQVKAGISDHDYVVANVDIAPHRNKCPRRKIFLYSKGDFNKISKEIEDFNRSLSADKIASSTVEELWCGFTGTVKCAMKSHIPSKESSSRHNLPWLDNSLKREIRKKQRLYNRAKRYTDM